MQGNIDGAALYRRSKMPGTQRKLGCTSAHFMVFPCLVPRPHYSARPKRFGSRGPSKDVRRSPPVRLGYVTKVNWPRGTGKTLYRPWLGKLFPFRTRSLPFLMVDATIGNQAFSHERCIIFPGWSYDKANNTFLNSIILLLMYQFRPFAGLCT